jgi:mRNA-degrading endonuclease RelE of RelBE toxin-antitoxin system
MNSTSELPTRRKILVRTYKPTGNWGRKIQQAADLQARIQLLEAQLKELRSEFLVHMQHSNLDRLQIGDFRVTRKVRNSWEYSPETSREMLKVQQMQRWEQSQGLAKNNPTVYIALHTIV